MIKHFYFPFVAAGMALLADVSLAQPAPPPGKAGGMVMLDYQVIPVPGDPSIDLMGFHFLNRINDWFYLGVGGYAPLVKGQYGGFMALDVTAHAQRRIYGNLFADAGVSFGGGGGGKTVEQSKILSGTGGFTKTYIGLGYDFADFSVGANVAKMKFMKSAINHSQLNVFLQVPFSYNVGPFASAGERFVPAGTADTPGAAEPGENILTLGLDNYSQIRPEGLNKGRIGVADLQFSHFMTSRSYWYVNAAVGYHGLPLYNHVLGGLGYRFPVSSRVNLAAQVAVGSGGYAPETINTGPGLLVYPKVSAEYLIDKNFGLALSAGYLFAPKGSSKNYTLGAALNYHIRSVDAAGAADGIFYKGYRVSLFPQTEFGVRSRGIERDKVKMLSAQLDSIVSDHLYIPVQVSIAYNAYLDKPGYGELLAGLGVQSKHDKDSRWQLFGQLLVGTNSHGPLLKTGAGLNFGLSDQSALYALVGQTIGVNKDKFRADYVGVGLSHRFSVPSR